VVLTEKLVHGMPCVVLDDLWHLPCRTSEASILSDGIDVDERMIALDIAIMEL
jgi:hypothetical protein